MQDLTAALTTALLAVLTAGVPVLILLVRTWASAKVVALEAQTAATKAAMLGEAAKRAAGQVYAEMHDAAANAHAQAQTMDTALQEVTTTVAANFADTVKHLGGSPATVGGMIFGELGKLLAASPTEALPKPPQTALLPDKGVL